MDSARRLFNACLFGFAMLGVAAPAAAAQPGANRVVLQISDADPAIWNQALNVARNIQQAFGKDKVSVEIVAFGNGIDMVKFDSTVASRIGEAAASGVSVVACENTMKARKLNREDINDKVGFVPAGVVEIMKKQKKGWSYIKL